MTANPGAFVAVGGRDLTLPRVVQADKWAFHVWCNAKALADVKALEGFAAAPGRDPTPDKPISREDYYRLLDGTQARVTTGYYSFHEVGGQSRLATDDGLAYLCWLCLKRADDTVTLADVVAIPPADLAAAYRLANADPNPAAPATGRGTPTGGIGDGSADTSPKSLGSAPTPSAG